MNRAALKKWSLIVLAASVFLFAPAASARKSKKDCATRCDEKIATCVQGCRMGVERAKEGNKEAAFQKCKEACGQFKEKCMKRCAEKSR